MEGGIMRQKLFPIFVTLGLIGGAPLTQAKDLSNRLGIGYTNQILNEYSRHSCPILPQ